MRSIGDGVSLQLWIAYPDDLLNEDAAARCAAILNGEDCFHWRHFKFAQYRRESLTTRALVRTALSHHRPVPPRAWCFATNEYGKPAVEPDCGLRFNASNSEGLVVCLLVAGLQELGVDVEPHARAEMISKLASDVFSAGEQQQLEELSGEQKFDRALSIWTLKEAYIKARGQGLTLPLDKFSFLFQKKGDIRLEIDRTLNDQAERWRFFILDHADHRIAAVIERPPTGNLQLLESRPAVASPVPLNRSPIVWFPCE